jgi:Holliday junction resolvase-like predicted endonuclease
LKRWRILSRNLRIGYDELDIVALSPCRCIIAVVEVKASRGRWPTMDRVDAGKFARLQRAADALPRHWRANRRVRIDVALVKVRGLWSSIQMHEGLRD